MNLNVRSFACLKSFCSGLNIYIKKNYLKIYLWCEPPVRRNAPVQTCCSKACISLSSARKSQSAASRFFIERIGLKESYSTKLPKQMGYKRRPMVKRRKLHSKGKSHVQISSSHLGVRRHFAEQNFKPRPFDGSTVKGKIA